MLKKNMWVVIAILLIGVGGLAGYVIIDGLFGGAPAPTTTPTTTTTEATFQPRDLVSGELLDDIDIYDNPRPQFSLYYLDLDEYTGEIDDIGFTDYTLDTAGYLDGLELEPETNYIYALNSSQTGFSDVWMRYDGVGSLPAVEWTSSMPLITLGVNKVYFLNESSFNLLAYDENLSVTFNQTDGRKWTVAWNTPETDQGFQAEYNRTGTNPSWTYFGIRVTFNTTATPSWLTAQTGYKYVERIQSTTTITLALGGAYYSSGSYGILLGSGLGTDFEVTTVSIGIIPVDSVGDWVLFADKN